MARRLEDQVAIITGAAGGIGAATARRFAAEGARLVLTDIDSSRLEPLGDTTAHDVTSETDWDNVVELAVRRHGRIDILVNNAGIFLAAPLTATCPDDFRRVMDTNVLGVFLGIRAVAPAMAASDAPAIVNVSSVAGMSGTPRLSAYAASKWAVRGLTHVAARELAREGIRVVSVHPGQIDTEMNARERLENPAVIDALIAATPMRRLGAPEEVAQAIAFLASRESSYTTGAELVLDGGLIA